ncbi:MAG: DUF151 domain-containing protein [bacterium]|nr:DUF151 domain-containing protein [bacterium]
MAISAAPDPELRRVRVRNVLLDSRTTQPVVLLEEIQGGKVLPIWIGPSEAQAILMEMRKIRPPRPMTHDLLRDILGGLRARIDRVVITEMKSGTFYSKIHLQSEGRSLIVDSRPSDAIALALRAGAPIYVREKVMQAAFPSEEGRDLTHRARLGLIVQKMTPALSRYFGAGKADGLLVSKIMNGGPAARAGLRPGDVIYQVGGKPVSSVRAFEENFLGHSSGFTVSVRRGHKGEGLEMKLSAAPEQGGRAQ